jgi:hypothetical protein
MVYEAPAGNSTVGVTVTSDRDPDKFADPKDMKYELNGAYTFDRGVIFGGLFQYNDKAFSDRTRRAGAVAACGGTCALRLDECGSRIRGRR